MATVHEPTTSGNSYYCFPFDESTASETELRMRDMFRKHVTVEYDRVDYDDYGCSYVLQTYRDIPLQQSGEVLAKNIGVGFVKGHMNSGFFWTLASKGAVWNGKTTLLDALNTNIGPSEICFQCVWFDADKPGEHPEVTGKLDRNRRFAEIVYKCFQYEIAPPPPKKFTVFEVGR